MRASRPRPAARWLLLAAGLGLLASCSGCRQHATPASATATSSIELSPLWIDTRLPAAFAAGHVPGALNLQWDWDQLEERIAAYAPRLDQPLLLRASSPHEALEAIALLEARGYVTVSAPPPPPETAALPTLSAEQLASLLDQGADLTLIDVRSRAEHLTGTIDGAVLVDPDSAAGLLPELDPDHEYAVICEGGYRSSQLASWMQRSGFPQVYNVIDGMAAWRAR